MASRLWINELGDEMHLRVKLTTFFGEIVDFSVALVHKDECIARYDTAHGFAHLDRLGRKNALIKKEICEKLSWKEAFDHAINDLSENARKHLDYFESH